MKRPAVADDLVPIHEFRANLAAWIERIEETGRPVVLTQRGRAAAVLITPGMLDEVEEQREVVRKVLRGLREVAAGELLEDEEVWDEVERVIGAAERKRARPVE